MKARSLTMASAALAVGIATLAAGCGTTTKTTTGTAPTTPKSGGTLTVALPPQTNLDWYLPINTASSDQIYNGWMDNQIYKPLIFLNDQYQIVWKSSIASKITYNKAGTVYHVFIGKNWKWSTGQPVTANDLMFTWNVVKAASASNAPTPWPFVGAGTGDIPSGIQSVVENNSHEVTFTLKQPANQEWFIYNGLIQLVPMPSAELNLYAKGPNPTAADWTKEVQYLGSIGSRPSTAQLASDGPFELVSATPNQTWIMKPNPDYGGYKPKIGKLDFVYEASSTAEFSALRQGQISLGYLDPSQLGAKAQLTSQGDRIVPAYTLGVYWTELNMWPGTSYASIFDQLYIRKALEMATDQQAIADQIYKGYAIPSYGPIPPVPKTKFYDPSAEPTIAYDPTAAKKLLEAHGWHLKNGVMINAQGKPLNLTFLWVTGSSSGQQIVQLMQQDWKAIGVQTTLKGVNFNQFLTDTSNKHSSAWQVATGSGWVYNGPGWLPTGGQLFSSTAPSGTGYANNEEDALIAATHKPYPSEADFLKAFFKYEAYTAQQLPMLWEPNFGSINVISANTHGAVKWGNPVTANPQYNHMWLSSSN
ncbi:peptide ABC transporter substrate-binding protein [Sulfobacillus harzensis]|uniref:Peptide ABC transporter substrate-binding protein n=1 Tax=Sulfobacillus harzensis TaxID=2729629 RepID=A0A7Y0Q2V9_9FIRM|nr:peptide ABC transporter substrate-binding protein [Sulfobacillus harzensis]NMP22291.1 peptide ABC transporter substrate-binding protein [Sulfobacillus harzensis]